MPNLANTRLHTLRRTTTSPIAVRRWRFSPTRFWLTGAASASLHEAASLRRQAKNALCYAERSVMPTSPAKAAWEAVIAVKEAA
jgi:hypothetical protein